MTVDQGSIIVGGDEGGWTAVRVVVNDLVPFCVAGCGFLSAGSHARPAGMMTATRRVPEVAVFPGHKRRRHMTTWTAMVGDQVIAESNATILLEGNRYYPAESGDSEVLERSWMRSLCYWKGVASCYTLTTGTGTRRHAAWTYRHPSPLARRIKGHIAFWPGDVMVMET